MCTQDRVTVVHGSWFSPLENQRGKLAGVMSNPPYIPSANIAKLQAEVGKHEPQSALDGGEDGLNDLRQICQGSSDSLRAGGFLVLEVRLLLFHRLEGTFCGRCEKYPALLAESSP